MVVLHMESNNYQLGSKNPELNDKAQDLIQVITFLSNERVYHNHFPTFATIDYNDIDEQDLIEAIGDLEKVYTNARSLDVHNLLHHKAYLYVLEETFQGFRILHNDTEYGDEPLTSAPVTGGETALDALKNAWKKWSIPPVLIMNSNYYCPNITIQEVVE